MSDMNALVPPHSLAAEQAVLGGLMLHNASWSLVFGLVEASDFYQPSHRLIFKAIWKLLSDEQAADIITVSELLKERGHSEQVGGLAYIGSIANNTPSSANIATYAQIVRDKSVLRQLIETTSGIAQMAYAGGSDVKALLAQVEAKIFDITQRNLRGKKGFVRVKDVVVDVLTRMEENNEKPTGSIIGQSYGFAELDGLTSGAHNGDLVIVAARPSMGKTTLAMNFAQACANSGKPVVFFSMEMAKIQLGERVLSSSSSVELHSIRESWRLNGRDDQWNLLASGVARIADMPIFIDDTPGLTVGDIKCRCMKLNAEIKDEFPGGIGMIVVDYIQLMGIDPVYQGNRANEVEVCTRGLKGMAKTFGVPVIALSQLNRNLESRPNKRPVMADLRDSGAIEQDADLVMFVYRDEVYNKDSEDKGIAELIIAKQRQGQLGTVRVGFEGRFSRFRSLSSGDYYEGDYYEGE